MGSMAIAALSLIWQPLSMCMTAAGPRLLHRAGLHVQRLISSSRHAQPIAPNHQARQLALDRTDQHWVLNTTYA